MIMYYCKCRGETIIMRKVMWPKFELPCGCRVGAVRYMVLTLIVRAAAAGYCPNWGITVFDFVHGARRSAYKGE